MGSGPLDRGRQWRKGDLTLKILDERFTDRLAAAEYLESIRWPIGPVCPHCRESERRPYKLPSKTRRLYKCAACRKQYTVTVGTIFESSHVPINKWLLAFYLLCSSKNGIEPLRIELPFEEALRAVPEIQPAKKRRCRRKKRDEPT